ncbi:MAG TPA: hypothetical protein VF062_03725, partial [Candidatus Limnocylindrales bacterium]
MTEARQIGVDVRSLTDMLIAQASGSGGRLTQAELASTVEAAAVPPAQTKKLLRALLEAGVTVEVDDSANNRRKVTAARAATPASKATTAKATPKAAATPKQTKAKTEGEDAPATPAKKAAKSTRTAKKAALKVVDSPDAGVDGAVDAAGADGVKSDTKADSAKVEAKADTKADSAKADTKADGAKADKPEK